MSTDDTTDVLTPTEAAKFLKVHPQTVLRMLRAGKLPANKIGSNWRLSRQALLRYLANEPQLVWNAPLPDGAKFYTGESARDRLAELTAPLTQDQSDTAKPVARANKRRPSGKRGKPW